MKVTELKYFLTIQNSSKLFFPFNFLPQISDARRMTFSRPLLPAAVRGGRHRRRAPFEKEKEEEKMCASEERLLNL